MKKWLLAIVVIAACLAAWFSLKHNGSTGTPPPAAESATRHPVADHPANVPPGSSALAQPAPSASNSPARSMLPAAALPGATSAAPSPVVALKPVASHPLEYTNLPPAAVLDTVRTAIRSFGSMFNGNPVGTNPEITRALNGGNPKQSNFIRPEAGMRINENGEMIDPWGTPYFFHQLSGHEMEIRSAGPDKIMWTSDDLVTE